MYRRRLLVYMETDKNRKKPFFFYLLVFQPPNGGSSPINNKLLLFLFSLSANTSVVSLLPLSIASTGCHILSVAVGSNTFLKGVDVVFFSV